MRSRRRTGLTLLATIALAGCAAGSGGSGSNATSNGAQEARFGGPLPAAETLGDDLIMRPIGRDARGCVEYEMQSKRRPALNAVFYRTRAGDFSTIKEEAACT